MTFKSQNRRFCPLWKACHTFLKE